ncbi:hypothetical protein H920_06837 [Fukomys damarensis]|uniref:Uncharacterized protein n=1 Tax=Fukomys damarensis TaxID=885580 RepID=A0A091E9C3_FUKDA|nr:hypothetical protein H920_06837 [Fukomys damarensis]
MVLISNFSSIWSQGTMNDSLASPQCVTDVRALRLMEDAVSEPLAHEEGQMVPRAARSTLSSESVTCTPSYV